MLYIIFENDKTYNIADLATTWVAQNEHFKQVYFMGEVPAFITQDNASAYNFSVKIEAGAKSLIVEKKQPTFAELKAEKRRACEAYGNSPAVDGISVHGRDMVVNSELRSKLYMTLNVLDTKGIATFAPKLGDFQMPATPTAKIREMLNAVEFRASENWAVLQTHIAEIDKITSAEQYSIAKSNCFAVVYNFYNIRICSLMKNTTVFHEYARYANAQGPCPDNNSMSKHFESLICNSYSSKYNDRETNFGFRPKEFDIRARVLSHSTILLPCMRMYLISFHFFNESLIFTFNAFAIFPYCKE